MKETFNLSEKIWKVCSDPLNKEYDLDVIDIEDVKEFISRLKEELVRMAGIYRDHLDVIDKLVGDLSK